MDIFVGFVDFDNFFVTMNFCVLVLAIENFSYGGGDGGVLCSGFEM